ncbi:GrpB family protein [Virgibacillus sp. 179-BFC.A HS]|uniref:GrpB family protein n=1 Tax=Tigheibacillus jepli TaxID=3035914 RepID=A0ABU5CJA0_9BACI|nr:GrpB family protein [Virgibacillus sp. 179-BFC.A HS]MDY0406431.1 GrpB family protein [Virgibacillus sp. 179-BFC.A HS]
MKRKVEVVAYDLDWQEKFAAETKWISAIFGEQLLDIHHIGSTSVKGMQAKPIIDIMPVVKNVEKVDMLKDEMEAIGYEAMGAYGIAGRRFFRKGMPQRTHHVHVFQQDNQKDIDRHLAVRDYLRTHPDAARKYGELKSYLAKRFPFDMDAYIEGKDSFVKELERKALAWYKR